jgi:hypothetical protein
MEEDKKLYKSMIGNLLYVKTSRLDVMQEVGIVARFQSAPKESHVQEVKRSFRYMKGTLDYGLWYPKGEDFTLKTYIYVEWEGYVDDRKKNKWRFILCRKFLSFPIEKK